jgi:carbon storage regulator
MLVLSRKSNESVVVGGPEHSEHLLKVTVLEIGNGRVRLGFEANGDVPIHRLEVWERIRAGSAPEAPKVDPAAPQGTSRAEL